MSINCPAAHPELHQTGVQIFLLCADKCISFHSFVVPHRKPRRKHIWTNTKLFCPCDRLCVESACFLHTPCGFSQPNVNVALPWSPNCQNVCVKKKKKVLLHSDICCKYFVDEATRLKSVNHTRTFDIIIVPENVPWP